MADRNRRAERHEGARSVADRVAHHLGELARERPLPLLDALPREDMVFQHEIVRDGRRNDDEVRTLRGEGRADDARLRGLQLAAVAAAALRVEEEIVALQNLRDVRLERDEVRRVLGVAPDRYRARDVAVD